MRTFIYVDGFNLYYGALKGTAWKWLDLVALFERVLQRHHEIIAIKYFTARVSGTSVDQSKPQRQDVYLRALRHYRFAAVAPLPRLHHSMTQDAGLGP